MSIDNHFSRFQEQSGFKSNLRIVGIISVLFCILAFKPPILAQEGIPYGVNPKICPHRITNLYPPAFDWRCVGGYSFVSPVKDQGDCASCTAFAVTSTLESIALIQHFGEGLNPELENLSETTLFFCNVVDTQCPCSNTLEPGDALRYCRDTGLMSTTGVGRYRDILEYCAVKCCGDKDKQKECQKILTEFRNEFCKQTGPEYKKIKVKITDYGLFFNPISIKQQIATKGPVIFVFACDEKEFFEHKGDGIIKVGGAYLHSVSCIGYDDQKKAWLCKNSMGTDWGNKGFFWLAYLEDNVKNYESLKAYYIDGFVEVEED